MKKSEEIKKDVVNRLASDSRVDASDIKVTVDDYNVTLEGTVPTYSNKVDAGNIAWYVMGVTQVNNNLDVKFPTTFRTPSDMDIKSSIEKFLMWNTQINQENIKVKVENGYVTLDGTVPTFWEKSEAEKEANTASGVIMVTNKLAVVPTEKVTDEILGDRIMDRIQQNTPAIIDNINIKVEDGNINLSGSVPSWNVWHSVYDTIESTVGVKDVNDNLNINYAF